MPGHKAKDKRWYLTEAKHWIGTVIDGWNLSPEQFQCHDTDHCFAKFVMTIDHHICLSGVIN